MWTYDEISDMNPPQPGQKTSVFNRLITSGATWPELLTDSANKLSDLGPPHISCFTQLPYPVVMDNSHITLSADRKGIYVDFDFRPIAVKFFDNYSMQIRTIETTDENKSNYDDHHAICTQVVAYVSLWGKWADDYHNYLTCLHPNGLDDKVISMHSTKWQQPQTIYANSSVTAHTFEVEVAERLQKEVKTALRRFLRHYSIAAFQACVLPSILPNYHVMIAPGRIATSEPPSSILPLLLNDVNKPFMGQVSQERVQQLINFGLLEIGDFIHRLIRMDKLARDGEIGLALIGAVTAIEMYMNSFIDIDTNYSKSLDKALRHNKFKSLPAELKVILDDARSKRNAITHGTPMQRRQVRKDRPLKELGCQDNHNVSSVNIDYVRSVIEAGLMLYREMNTQSRLSVKQETQ